MHLKSHLFHEFVDRKRLRMEVDCNLAPVRGRLSSLEWLANEQRLQRMRFVLPGLLVACSAGVSSVCVWLATSSSLAADGDAAVLALMSAIPWLFVGILFRMTRQANATEFSYLLHLVRTSASARRYIATLTNHLERPRAFEVTIAEKLAHRDFADELLLSTLIRERVYSEIRSCVEGEL